MSTAAFPNNPHTDERSVLGNPVPEQSGTSHGVRNRSAWRRPLLHTAQKASSYGVGSSSSCVKKPIALFGTRRRRYRQLLSRSMPRHPAGNKTNVTRKAYINAMWERFGKTAFQSTIAIHKSTTTPTFSSSWTHSLEGCRVTLKLKRTFCSKISVSTHSENVYQIVSPIDSFLSKIHWANVHVFSDSVLRLVMQAMSDATGNLNRRLASKRSQGGSTTSQGINSNFL